MYQSLSIILPVYNQADHIREIVREYEAALKRVPIPYEILLTVNGSRDKSLEVCREIAAEIPTVKTFHSVKGGWGLGVKMGLKEAKGDLICYSNSARTHPQDLILLILYAITNPGVVIKANRKIRDSAFRRMGSLLYNLECRMLFDLSYWDINGTPKVFPRSFAKLMTLSRDDDLLDLEFNIICRRNNYLMLEVPIFSSQRHSGASTTKLKSAFRLYAEAYKMKRIFS